jgi:NADH-quinone oxidoreductase subunit L
LAICGVPVFSGFFSKDAIVAGSFATHAFGHNLAWVGPVVGWALLAAALGTAFYMSRLYFLVFTGECRADEHTREHLHESPVEMVGPLVVLALGAVVAGAVGLPTALLGERGEWLEHWLAPAVGHGVSIATAIQWQTMISSTVVAVTGIGLAWVFFGGGVREPARRFVQGWPRLTSATRGKFFVDEIYRVLVVRPLQVLSQALFHFFDRLIIDGLLVGTWSALADGVGRLLRLLQVGDIQRYVAVFAIGLAALVYVMARPADPSDIQVRVDGRNINIQVKQPDGAGPLRYGFDFNGDGAEDRTGAAPQASWSYSGPGRYQAFIRVTDPRWGTARTFSRTIEVR